MSVMEFGDPVTVVSVSLSGDNGAMMLRYPVWNTVREHMELVVRSRISRTLHELVC